MISLHVFKKTGLILNSVYYQYNFVNLIIIFLHEVCEMNNSKHNKNWFI